MSATWDDVTTPGWQTEPDGPGSGDDRYGETPGTEQAEVTAVTSDDSVDPELPFACGYRGCKRRFSTQGGMNHHRTLAHGTKPTTKYGKKKAAEKTEPKKKGRPKKEVPGTALAVPEARVKAPQTELLAADSVLSMGVLLEAMFPQGIPNQKIRATVNWVEATQDLTR